MKGKGWRKIYHASINQRKAIVAILILDKEGFRTRKIVRAKNEHYIVIEGSVSPGRHRNPSYACN